ncbi:MFS transporter [Bradyrhizobium sp.]|uniref:MFS transporter n=1 Tax=Bradyrhizobium sp. TaxID=376 RepID=UPI0039E3389C
MNGKNFAVSSMFFILGLCFGSWSSRIATIRDGLSMSDSMLGSVLLAMTSGLLISLPVSGWAITRFGSRTVGVFTIITIAALLALVPFVSSVSQLAVVMFVFGFSYSAVNVSNNTQASIVEKFSGETRLPFFHGLWGLAGFAGAGIGALTIGQGISLSLHFGLISTVAAISALACWRFLYNEPSLEQTGRAFAAPDRSLLNYGLIAFFGMACESIMYDWSTVYFQDVVSPDQRYVGIGFAVFMGAMTVGRLFILNSFVNRFGMRKTLQWSGIFILAGFGTAILFPSLVLSAIGFCLAGLGICGVIPLVAGAAARSSTMAPSSAIASVLTIGFAGLLIFPPLVGFLSDAVGLRYAFLVGVFLAIGTIYRASKIPE